MGQYIMHASVFAVYVRKNATESAEYMHAREVERFTQSMLTIPKRRLGLHHYAVSECLRRIALRCPVSRNGLPWHARLDALGISSSVSAAAIVLAIVTVNRFRDPHPAARRTFPTFGRM
jgi:hypothetical protein